MIRVELSGSQAIELTRLRPGVSKLKICRLCLRSHIEVKPFVLADARMLDTFLFQDAASISSTLDLFGDR